LHNNLLTDTEVASAVSQALARDPRTAHGYIGIYPALGVVHLRGVVPTNDMRQAAEEIARATPEVASVVNEIHVNPSGDVLPVMAGVTGDEDRVPGGA
ncbi:MAG TPA: BON domain-containing protein, partial [Ktedonobacterales bacterium]|nr:BON domain-containing protein [Ktedonobacterales bacterium]